MMNFNSTDLDNRLYNLQKETRIPAHLYEKVTQADILYLQEKDMECVKMLDEIEQELKEIGA